MKSSGPVFTRQNPFQPASRVGKAYYHPSCTQSLSKKKKKTTLSQRSSSQIHTLCPESPQLFEQCDRHFAATDGQPVFAESWPSTECGSSPASTTTLPDMETPNHQSLRARTSPVSSELGVQQDSVLAKYMDRFRRGQPQSREERQQMPSAIGEKQLPFWWMSPSSSPHSSTPTKTPDKDGIQVLKDDRGPAIFSRAGQRQHDGSLSPCRGSLSILSDTSQCEFDDTEIQHLQEKASRLLLRGECTLNDGSIPVSSYGLECSDFSSIVAVDEPVRRPLIPSLIRSTAKASSDSVQAVSSQKSSVFPSLVPPTRREEDILFQWRLRRKIEQAREWPQSLQHSNLHGPTFSWQPSSLNHPSASGQASKQHQSAQPPEVSQKAAHPHITATRPQPKEAHRSRPPASDPPALSAFVVSGSLAPQPQTIAHVPAHMHLLCDVLPCPIQSSRVSMQQHISESRNESQTKVDCKKTPGNSMNTFTDEPICEHIPSPTPASSGAVERAGLIHHKRSERSKKERAQTRESEKNEKTMPSFRKQKKSPRYAMDVEKYADGPVSTNRSSSHRRVPKKVMPWAEQQQQEGSQGFSSESCIGDLAPPPPSPIHSALGQAVSEVLFPTVDSSPAQRNLVSSVSPSCTASAPPQSSVPPCNAQDSMEVIAQLLQEAEDSDEKDFEDDPLLQVLRKQRKWVKEQISEVESVLNEFLDD